MSTVSFFDDRGLLLTGHCLDSLAEIGDESIDCCVTSPPYWGLRDYGDLGQEWPEVTYSPMPGYDVTIPAMVAPLGQEPEPAQYIGHLVLVFREVRRVLKSTGTLWLNLGDSYLTSPAGNRTPSGKSQAGKQLTACQAQIGGRRKIIPGVKPKDLCGIPWLAAFALRSDGWYLRNDVIWSKPNPMPSSVTDRLTNAHEYMFLLTKAPRYFYDADAVRESSIGRDPGNFAGRQGTASYHVRSGGSGTEARWRGTTRNKRTVWTIVPKPYKGAHFATMPPGLVEPAIKAGCPQDGIVIDPFFGSGTVGAVAESLGRAWVGLDQSADYAQLAIKRICEAR